MPLKLIRRDGTPYWYLHGSVRGIRVRESTGFADKALAEEARIKKEYELQQRSLHGDMATRTFAEAALSYIEGGGERNYLLPILEYFGETKVAAIGQSEISACAKKLKPGTSSSTLNRKIYTPISAVLHHAAKLRWAPAPVISRPSQPKGRVRWITTAEADRLIFAASDHLEPLVVFLLYTGARLSEALYLDWKDVDLERAHVVFRDTKNGEDRGVPLHPRVIVALANVEWGREGAVFRRPAGKIHRTGRVWLPYESRDGKGGGQVKTAWAGMVRRAGLRNFTPHDCRHTWASWHYQIHRDLFALMQLGGWKTLTMVQRYAHVNADHLAPSIKALA